MNLHSLRLLLHFKSNNSTATISAFQTLLCSQLCTFNFTYITKTSLVPHMKCAAESFIPKTKNFGTNSSSSTTNWSAQ